MTWNEKYNNLLRDCVKPIVHMRAQHKNRRLSLMLGTGVSKPLNIPDWEELVNRIAQRVNGEELIASQPQGVTITSRIQLLFEYFYRSESVSEETSGSSEEQGNVLFFDPTIRKKWYEIVREELYKTLALEGNNEVLSHHPYLGAYVDVIRKSPMTVNYNFDDSIERMLSELNKKAGQPIREGYESVWDINLQFKSNAAIIYHPNGYLPYHPLEKRSDWLVFSEDEYADQLIYSMTGYFASLAHHLSKNTCLLIGLSLQDSTLRNLLRQSARINPGHYHYYVRHVKDGQYPAADERDTVTSLNFKVYNLITLFLTDEEIRLLGELITMAPDEFQYNANQNRHNIKYCFYVSGAIGAGKSTVLSYFHSLNVHDEWPERRPLILAMPPDDLTEEQEKEADRWVASQFDRKNWNLFSSPEGIHVVDRSPLDPLGFTEEGKWPNKAKYLLNEACRSAPKIEPGRVILLLNDPKILAIRIKTLQQGYTSAKIDEQQNQLRKVYSLPSGTTFIDTRGLTTNEVVKAVAHIIHMQKYDPPAELHERLVNIRGEENE